MNESPESSSVKTIWNHLLYGGLSAGIFLGLLEICWVYSLPKVFPGRHYELPISTVGWFVLIALAVDILFVLIGAVFLGLVISVVRKIWRRARSFNHWPTLICFLLITGVLSYLYAGLVYTYYFFDTFSLKRQAVAIGVLLIALISALIVWALVVMKRRFGKVAPKVAWAFVIIALICTIIPNYLSYRSENKFEMELPTLGKDQLPNILLVTLDTLRADYLACYGNKIVQTPVLDALAADGYLFEAAFAQASSTTPSHCSIMTSTYVARHGAMNGSAMKVRLPQLSEILQYNGYETAAFLSCNMVRSSNSGLHHGFDYYEDSISPYTTLLRHDETQLLLAAYLLTKLGDNQIPGHIVSNRALAWIDKHAQKPFFYWLHYFDPHTPYDAPAPYKDMYNGKIDPTLPFAQGRTNYAGEVTYTDYELGRIIKALKDKGLYDDMMIIVTADHGESLGEKHGDITEFEHGSYLYGTTQHIPLIIKMPKGKGAGRRIQNIVQHIDLAPTVLDYLNASMPKSFEGKSLLDLLDGKQRSEPGVTYAETGEKVGAPPGIGQTPETIIRRSMRTREYKYIYNTAREKQELYDMVADPLETTNVYANKRKLAKSFYLSIMDILGKPVETEKTAVDPRVLEQLRSLGYIDDGETPEK